MTTVALMVGSVLGTALDVAEQLQEALVAEGYTVILEDKPQDIPDANVLLFCTSTTGRGHFPSALVPLVNGIEAGHIAVTGRLYGLIALGDSRYPTFCGAGRHLDDVLTQQGAIRIGERLELDASGSEYPDEEALAWLPKWLAALDAA
ncbi:flavodoxin domain-containing protein [Zymobacter sp. IVIA_12111.31 C1]|uniref:flavodoxin domain-containing protein n=1 Tax=Zymobacter sp. IVIA_12111.31 C1 TaxID=3394854 RepID=UPI0039C05455